MALDPRKRQKKLERRKAKSNAKRKAAAGRSSRELTTRIERAAGAPILHCCTTSVLWDQGMSNVLLSRTLNTGNVAFVAFLADLYCLGVKDVTFDVVSRSRYDWQVYNKLFGDYEVRNLKPEAARKLIEGAVDYAAQIGLSPHHDYHKATPIFGDIDPSSCSEDFAYGKDGKPYFVAGPHDSPSRCRLIIDRLTERCGPDGFHYFMPLSESGAMPSGARVLAIDHDGGIKEAPN
jgi:hypothetical protein